MTLTILGIVVNRQTSKFHLNQLIPKGSQQTLTTLAGYPIPRMLVSYALITSIFFGILNAQVQVKGRFQETVMALQKSALVAPSLIYQPVEKVNNIKLQMVEMFADASSTKPFKFAESLEMTLDIAKDGSWQDTRALDATPIKIWRAIVASDEALSMSLQFEQFRLPEGAEFYIIGRDNMMGAFTAKVNNKADGSFATVPIPGDFLGLEIVIPLDKNKESTEKMLREQLKFKVSHVAHGFRPFPKSFNDSGSCNIDVACEPKAAYVIFYLYTNFYIVRSLLG